MQLINDKICITVGNNHFIISKVNHNICNLRYYAHVKPEYRKFVNNDKNFDGCYWITNCGACAITELLEKITNSSSGHIFSNKLPSHS